MTLHIYDPSLESVKLRIVQTACQIYEAREEEFTIKIWMNRGVYHAMLSRQNGQNIMAMGASCSGVLSILHSNIR